MNSCEPSRRDGFREDLESGLWQPGSVRCQSDAGMYTDSEGNSRFPLDEYLGLRPKQLASPSMTESVVAMAAEMPYRKVAETVSALTAGELSPKTVHRLLQSVGEEALAEEQERWEAQFERGEDMCEGRQIQTFSTQRPTGCGYTFSAEEQKHYEVKCGIAYRGWRRIAEDRYELVGKRVYAHGDDAIPFWEGASLEWAKQYALDRVKLFVVGGDGANWIRSGVEEFGNAIFQLDGFHLSPRLWSRLRRRDRSGSLRCDTLRIAELHTRVDGNGASRRDRDGDQRQGVHQVQRGYRNRLAQPCPQRLHRALGA